MGKEKMLDELMIYKIRLKFEGIGGTAYCPVLRDEARNIIGGVLRLALEAMD